MSDLVIDASVAVKWVIEEEGTKEALALRGLALTAPDLLIAECADILWKKVRRSELSEREAAFAAGLLARADIDLVAMRPYLETAVRIAFALDHLAYDCLHRTRRSRRAPICDCEHEPGAEGRTAGVRALRRPSTSLGRRRDLAGIGWRKA